MDIPIAVHVDSGVVETHNDEGKLILQARSLRNTLSILKTRLRQLQADAAHTFEDVEHYKVRWSHMFLIHTQNHTATPSNLTLYTNPLHVKHLSNHLQHIASIF